MFNKNPNILFRMKPRLASIKMQGKGLCNPISKDAVKPRGNKPRIEVCVSEKVGLGRELLSISPAIFLL
jgi:hypothetical protein